MAVHAGIGLRGACRRCPVYPLDLRLVTYQRVIDARFLVSVLCTGILSFSGVLVGTALNVAFPSLMRQFGIETSTVQWVTTGYLLVLAIVLPVSSYLKRSFATRHLFVASTVLFIAGTVLCAVTPVFAGLLVGRMLQGLGTGMALPLMFSIVLEQAPFNRMGMMMGAASAITALAPAVGPSVGGLVIERWGWRMIFVILVPLLLLSLIAGVWAIRQVGATTRERFDVWGWLVLAGGFVALLRGLSASSERGWGSPEVLGGILLFVLLMGVFAMRSRRIPDPLIRVSVFSHPAFVLALAGIMLTQFGILALGYLLPNVGQEVLGASAFQAGCILLPGCVLGVIFAPLSGGILDRFGASRPIALGSGAIVVSLTLMLVIQRQGGSVAAYMAAYVLFAGGQGLCVPTGMTHAYGHVPEDSRNDSNAVMNTLQQLAGASGTAVVASIVSADQRLPMSRADSTNIGAGTALIVLSGVAVAAMVCFLASLVWSARRGDRR